MATTDNIADPLLLARREILAHIMEHEQPTASEWQEWTSLLEILPIQGLLPRVPVAKPQSRGIKPIDPEAVQKEARGTKRGATTPESKVAIATSKSKAAKFESAPEVKKTCVDTVFCQVCQLPASRWPACATPLLLNSMDQPVKVPGSFCSKVCYEHV